MRKLPVLSPRPASARKVFRNSKAVRTSRDITRTGSITFDRQPEPLGRATALEDLRRQPGDAVLAARNGASGAASPQPSRLVQFWRALPRIPQGPPPGTIIAEGPLTAVAPSGFGGAAATYTSLTSESARLERLLNDIPYRPRLVNAGTATMISGLQDRIGQVDQVLMYSSVEGLQPEQTMALWQERVDLMNALVRVRYAEAQRFGF